MVGESAPEGLSRNISCPGAPGRVREVIEAAHGADQLNLSRSAGDLGKGRGWTARQIVCI